MAVSTAQRPMLYCPKCNRTYEDGAQRFCTVDGSRLLSAPLSVKSAQPPKAVFSNLLHRPAAPDKSGKSSVFITPFVKDEREPPVPPKVQPPVENEYFQPPEETENAENVQPPLKETKQPEPVAKPLPRLIRPNEIPAGQASLGDRRVNPTGRLALTWDNTKILLGQTVKGRYYVVDKLNEDETSIAYLAEDKIVAGKKVVIRVLMEEHKPDDFASKIFAEERVSLSHINHPNVAFMFDSGQLLEGKSFIVTEYVAGESLKEKLQAGQQFNPLRAARIIRQAASALSEVHENGILHRNLKPQNIILKVSEAGAEQVKVTDFAVFDGFDEQSAENIKYQSPEQLEGRLPNYASDIYSLAVIAYQMLTGRVPFNFSTEKELLKAQKEGLSLTPTNLRLDLPPAIDEILERALAYKPFERYGKAREFGDAFFNALNAPTLSEKPTGELPSKDKIIPVVETELPALKAEPEQPVVVPETKAVRADISALENKEVPKTENLKPENSKSENLKQIKTVKAPPPLAWEKRSPEPPQTASTLRLVIYGLLVLLLGTATWAIWNQFSQRQNAPVYTPPNNAGIVAPMSDQNNNVAVTEAENVNSVVQAEPTPKEIESPPLTRQITQPPDTEYFQNSKENLKGDLARNFRGFSFYYPKDWTKKTSQDHFIDVARTGATGTPIEQMLVSYYNSKGTFAADTEIFPQLVQKSNKDIKESLGGNYKLISQGEAKINGDWKAYEMKFQHEGLTKNGDKITLWGRRLWIPAARQGVRSGFVITMLATSLSPEVKSADDVGVKGELATVLSTFEPTSLDAAY